MISTSERESFGGLVGSVRVIGGIVPVLPESAGNVLLACFLSFIFFLMQCLPRARQLLSPTGDMERLVQPDFSCKTLLNGLSSLYVGIAAVGCGVLAYSLC